MTHYTPDSNTSKSWERVSVCGVTCAAGGRDGKEHGSSKLENVDCPACLEMSRQVEMFGGAK